MLLLAMTHDLIRESSYVLTNLILSTQTSHACQGKTSQFLLRRSPMSPISCCSNVVRERTDFGFDLAGGEFHRFKDQTVVSRVLLKLRMFMAPRTLEF